MRVVTPGTLTDAALLDAKRDSLLRRAQSRRGSASASHGSISPAAQLRAARVSRGRARRRARAARAERAAVSRRHGVAARSRGRARARAAAMALRRRRRAARACASSSARTTSRRSASTIAPLGGRRRRRAAATTRQRRSRPRSRTCARSPSSAPSDHLALDAATRRNLEITETLRGEPAPTLLSLLDSCATAAGSRLLRHWLHHPLRAQEMASARHAAIAALVAAPRRALRTSLRDAAQAHRRHRAHRRAHRARHARGRAISSGPARHARAAARARASRSPRVDAPLLARRSRAALAVDPRWHDAARRAPSPPSPRRMVRDGGVIARGYDAELDELRAIAERLRRVPGRPRGARARAHRHRQPQGRVQPRARLLHRGHATRTSQQGSRRLPPPPDAEERRALHHAGAEGVRGQGAVGAGARARAREAAVRGAARRARAARSRRCSRPRARSPTLDVLATLAEQRVGAATGRARRSRADAGIAIRGGRHPVVETQVEHFIPNDRRALARRAGC